MGPEGHKEANLIYPFYYSIVRDDEIYNPYDILEDAKRCLQEGFIDKITFDSYTNLIYDFSIIYPENYYNLSDLENINTEAYIRNLIIQELLN